LNVYGFVFNRPVVSYDFLGLIQCDDLEKEIESLLNRADIWTREGIIVCGDDVIERLFAENTLCQHLSLRHALSVAGESNSELFQTLYPGGVLTAVGGSISYAEHIDGRVLRALLSENFFRAPQIQTVHVPDSGIDFFMRADRLRHLRHGATALRYAGYGVGVVTIGMESVQFYHGDGLQRTRSGATIALTGLGFFPAAAIPVAIAGGLILVQDATYASLLDRQQRRLDAEFCPKVINLLSDMEVRWIELIDEYGRCCD